jgi:predicted nucleic acid-binding protein
VKFLSDTNVVSEAMRKNGEPKVLDWFHQNQDTCFLSALTVAEIEKGIELLPSVQRRDSLRDKI